MENSMDKNILYLALGDSITAGVGSGHLPGFVQRYEILAEKALEKNIVPQVFAVPGATTGDVLNIVKDSSVRTFIGKARIITLSAGGNDLIQASRRYLREEQDQEILREALVSCKKNVSTILNEIKQIKISNEDSRGPLIVRIVDLYNPFQELELANKWVTLFNRHLKTFANGRVAVTNLYDAFKGNEENLLSFDKIHPNPNGYQVIAKELNKLGYSPLE
jgi:lysophospholipase L1-like esterase